MVNITINNIPLQVEEGTKIIEAAKKINIDIPHLCYHPDLFIIYTLIYYYRDKYSKKKNARTQSSPGTHLF